jgi:hypothetical protein
MAGARQRSKILPMKTVTSLQMVDVKNDVTEGLTLADRRRRIEVAFARRSPRRSFRERVLSLPLAPQPRFA